MPHTPSRPSATGSVPARFPRTRHPLRWCAIEPLVRALGSGQLRVPRPDLVIANQSPTANRRSRLGLAALVCRQCAARAGQGQGLGLGMCARGQEYEGETGRKRERVGRLKNLRQNLRVGRKDSVRATNVGY